MVLTVTNPYGQATSQGFPFTPVATVTWTPRLSSGVNIFNGNLTVEARGGTSGQGTCVSPTFAKSANLNDNPFYWETTWTGLLGVSLLIGVGVLDTDALVGVTTPAQLASVFNALAIDGTNGCLLRPSGEVLVNGESMGIQTMGNGHPISQQQDDTIGFELGLANPVFPTMSFFSVAGPSVISNGSVGFAGFFGGGNGFLPASGNFVPCAVFDTASALDIWILTANFGAIPSSLIGPTIPDLAGFLNPSIINMGWPP